MFPKIKKEVTSFLVGEEGKISKQALLSGGAFLGTGVLGTVLFAGNVSAAAHTNDTTLDYESGQAQATHAHHTSSGVEGHSSGPCVSLPCSPCSPCVM